MVADRKIEKIDVTFLGGGMLATLIPDERLEPISEIASNACT
jgi:hypothetical protein